MDKAGFSAVYPAMLTMERLCCDGAGLHSVISAEDSRSAPPFMMGRVQVMLEMALHHCSTFGLILNATTCEYITGKLSLLVDFGNCSLVNHSGQSKSSQRR